MIEQVRLKKVFWVYRRCRGFALEDRLCSCQVRSTIASPLRGCRSTTQLLRWKFILNMDWLLSK